MKDFFSTLLVLFFIIPFIILINNIFEKMYFEKQEILNYEYVLVYYYSGKDKELKKLSKEYINDDYISRNEYDFFIKEVINTFYFIDKNTYEKQDYKNIYNYISKLDSENIKNRKLFKKLINEI